MKAKNWLLVGAMLFALVVILSVAAKYILVFSANVLVDQEKWGQFGDYFGGVLNPILSFFAFSALLYTVYLQLDASVEAERRHEEQVFDGRLFKLLSTNFEMASAISIKPNCFDLKFDGLQALDFSWGHFKDNYLGALGREDDLAHQFDVLRVKFKGFKRSYCSVVSVYFDSVILVLEFIRSNAQTGQHRSFALHALRSQMTSGSRGLLFYYLICSEEYLKHAQTIMDSSFLDDLTDDPLCDVRHQLLIAAQKFHQL
ncbi:hypothetical protein [Pseudomonas monteilii]|uniref:hypothetical protein n=1 Tax=Pseudomonas monteilii TaxID=76759 RepID=UPI0036E8352E